MSGIFNSQNTVGARNAEAASNQAQRVAVTDTIRAASDRDNGLGQQTTAQIIAASKDSTRRRLASTANVLSGQSIADANRINSAGLQAINAIS